MMNPEKTHGMHDIYESGEPLLIGALAAMQRAALLARQVAIQTNTAIITWRDGQVVRIEADQLRQEANNQSKARID